MSESPVDPQQQLYSEVLALRKELIVVKEDEERLRDQLSNQKLHKAALKPEVAADLQTLENEAKESCLKGIWDKQMAEQSPDRMDWTTIDISNLQKRLKAAHKVFLKAKKKADVLLSKQEKTITKNADHCDATKAKLKAAYDQEMESLKEARFRLHQVQQEEQYHTKRGTGVGRAPVAAEQNAKAKDSNRQAMVNKSIIRRAQLQQEHDDMEAKLKMLNVQIRESQRIHKARAAELQSDLRIAEDDGREANEVHAKLTAEKQRISKMREDMNRVLLFLRAKNKIE